MSRPTIAHCLALIEKQNLLIATLEDRLKRVENSQFQRKHDSASAPLARKKFVSIGHHAPAACKHFGVTIVTRAQLVEYVASL